MNEKRRGVGQNDPSSNRGTGGAVNTPTDTDGFDDGRERGNPPPSDRENTDLVTVLGLVSIGFGVLKLLCGGGVLFGFQYFYDDIVRLLESGDYPSPEQLSSTIHVVVLIIVIVLVLVPGLLQIIGGAGVLKRENWGRILTLILGGLDVLLALPQLLSGNPIGFVLSGGWGGFALYVLLSDPYQNEFFNH